MGRGRREGGERGWGGDVGEREDGERGWGGDVGEREDGERGRVREREGGWG